MNTDGLQIMSFLPNGEVYIIPRSSPFRGLIESALRDNIKQTENIHFSLLTTRGDFPASQNAYLGNDVIGYRDEGLSRYAFSCINLLDDRLFIITIEYIVEYDYKRRCDTYRFQASSHHHNVNLINIDNITYNKSNENYVCRFTSALQSNSCSVSYTSRYHGFLKPFLDQILKSAQVQKNNDSDLLAKLERLARLKQQGMLTDHEFELAKRKLLE